MFVQNFIMLSAAVYELSWGQRNKKKQRLYAKTILPSLPRAVITVINKNDSTNDEMSPRS